jgi:hypothetical protein
MTTGGYVLTSVIGGAVGGALGAYVADGASYPVLKGAVIVGGLNGLLALAVMAGAESQRQVTSGVNGVLPVRFP